MVFYLI